VVAELFQEFSFDIQCVKGKENVVVHVLFKRKWTNAISIINNGFINKLKGKYVTNFSFNAPFYALTQREKSL
jgi:hypothetical protein